MLIKVRPLNTDDNNANAESVLKVFRLKQKTFLLLFFPHQLIGSSVPMEDLSVIDLCLSNYYYIVFSNIYFYTLQSISMKHSERLISILVYLFLTLGPI